MATVKADDVEASGRRDDQRREEARSPASPGVRPDLLVVCDLRLALRQPGCAVCRLLRQADQYYLRVFLREGKDDGRMMLRLLASWGLCPRHASGIVYLEPIESGEELGGLGTGSLYDWLLDQARRWLQALRRDLEVERPAGRIWPRRNRGLHRVARVVERLDQRGVCPACEAQRERAAYLVGEFVRALEPAAGFPEIAELYQTSAGLCFPHWGMVRQRAQSPPVRDAIAGKQEAVVASLKTALAKALEGGVAGAVSQSETGDVPPYQRALSLVAGDPGWRPPER